ncbi:MAG TPA: RDD family protein [Solirubrobacteraceae bacterium]|jgi:uncharacterized RDD family membrane protein YckC
MNQPFAPYINRVGALILDGLIFGIPLAVLATILGLFDSTGGIIAYYALALVGSILYYVLLMQRKGERNGQTIGKQILEIRVVHETGTPMTPGRIILRETVGKFLIGFVTCGLYSIINYLWPLWDNRKQALHDKIGSTFVLRADVNPAGGGQLGSAPPQQTYGEPMSSPEQPAAAPQAPGGAPPPPRSGDPLTDPAPPRSGDPLTDPPPPPPPPPAQ